MNFEVDDKVGERSGIVTLLEVQYMAWLYVGLSGSGFLIEVFLGTPPATAMDWLSNIAQPAGVVVVLGLALVIRAEKYRVATRLCQVVAAGHIAYAVALIGLHEGMWLGYTEVGVQAGFGLLFLGFAHALRSDGGGTRFD